MNDSEPIEVYAVGSAVLVDGTVSARVTAIFIRGNGRITYEIVWWLNHERKAEVVELWEIQPDGEKARACRVNPIL